MDLAELTEDCRGEEREGDCRPEAGENGDFSWGVLGCILYHALLVKPRLELFSVQRLHDT
jgi:hypothetical protein